MSPLYFGNFSIILLNYQTFLLLLFDKYKAKFCYFIKFMYIIPLYVIKFPYFSLPVFLHIQKLNTIKHKGKYYRLHGLLIYIYFLQFRYIKKINVFQIIILDTIWIHIQFIHKNYNTLLGIFCSLLNYAFGRIKCLQSILQ